jgi:hypothetical protein
METKNESRLKKVVLKSFTEKIVFGPFPEKYFRTWHSTLPEDESYQKLVVHTYTRMEICGLKNGNILLKDSF